MASSAVLLVVLPALMVVANKSAPASLACAAILANVAALVAGSAQALGERYRQTLTTGTAVLFGVLALAAVLSLLWSVDLPMTRRGLIEALPELVFGWGLAAAWPLVRRPSDLGLLKYGLVAAALLIVFESRFGMPIHHLLGARAESFDMKRSAVPLVLLLWPALEDLADRRHARRWQVILVVAVLVAAGLAHSAASVLGVGLGLVVFGLATVLPRATLYGCGAVTAVLLVLTPWTGTIVGHALTSKAALLLKDQHASHRVQIWTAFEHHIRDKHLIGHGFDTSFRVADIVAEERGDPAGAAASDKVIDNIHPHDVLLQLWVEFGLAGAVAFGAAIVFVGAGLRRLPNGVRRYRLSFAASIAAVALVGLNAWAPWWLAVLAACLTLFANRPREAPPSVSCALQLGPNTRANTVSTCLV